MKVPNQLRPTRPLLILVLVLAALCTLVTGASAVNIATGAFQIPGVGETVSVPIVLDSAPGGLSGYRIVVSLSNSSVAAVTAVTFPDWTDLESASALPAARVVLQGVDLSQQVPAGGANVLLATLTVKGTATGSTNIVITPDSSMGVQDRNGNPYQVSTTTGTLTVTNPPVVTSITPDTGTQGSRITIANLAGREFVTGATVKLTRSGYTDIPATNVAVISSTKITCQFALPSTAETGAWNVVVTNPGGLRGAMNGGFDIASLRAAGYETPIVVHNADQVDPVLHGSRIVWQDWRNNNDYNGNAYQGDIYSYNLSSHVEQPEGASSSSYGKIGSDDFDPIVSDKGIFWVYEGWIGYETRNELRGRTLQGKPVSTPAIEGDGGISVFASDLAMDGNRLVYVVSTDPDWSGEYESRLVLYDTATGFIYTIREAPNEIRSPGISGNIIVWQEFDGSFWNIRRYSLTGGSVQTLAYNCGDQAAPVIDGTTAIWAQFASSNYDLYSCDLSESYPSVEPWLEAPGDQLNPAIDGDRVVWQDNRDGDWDIYMGSLSGGTLATVCTADNDQIAPDVDDDRIVWQDQRYGDWDVYMFTVSATTPPPVPTPVPLIITSPGTYSITADGYDGRETPIEIRSSDVVLDGGGHVIDGSRQYDTYGLRIVGAGGRPLSNVVVRNLRLTNWETGIYADALVGSVIESSEIAHNGKGIVLEDAQDVQIRNTRIFANDNSGIAVSESVNTSIEENEVLKTGDGFEYYTGETMPVNIDDVAVATSFGTRISGNELDGHYCSLSLNDVASTRVTGNWLTGDYCGIHGYTETEDNLVVDNVFDTGYDIYGSPGATFNTTPSRGPNIVGGPSIGGNFWAGFSETNPDANGDGFCDEPYRPEYSWESVDQLPLAPWTGPIVAMVPGGVALPTDTHDDGLYDDVNGNSRPDFADVVLYFNQMTWISANEPVALFDYNGNGRIDFADVVWLFNNL